LAIFQSLILFLNILVSVLPFLTSCWSESFNQVFDVTILITTMPGVANYKYGNNTTIIRSLDDDDLA